MFQELFNNLVVLIVFLLIMVFVVRAPNLYRHWRNIGIGIMPGVFDMIQMFIGVQLDHGIVVDLRQLAVLMAAYFGGIWASVVAAVMISVFRILYFGLNHAAINATITVFALAIIAGWLSPRIHNYWKKWIVLIVMPILFSIFSLINLLGLEESFRVIKYTAPFLLFGGILVACLIRVLYGSMRKSEIHQTLMSMTHYFRGADINSIYEKSLKESVRLFGAHYGSIISIEYGVNRAINAYMDGQYRERDELIYDKDIEIINDVRLGNVICTPDWNKSRNHGEIENKLYESGIRSSINVPIVYNDSVIAMLSLASRGANHFQYHYIEEIKQLTPLISFAIALKDIENMFESVNRSSYDAIIMTDHQMNIQSWNLGASRIFHYGSQELIGESMQKIVPLIHKELTYEERMELVGVRKDSSEFPIELSIDSWELSGRTFFSCIIRDTTERKEAERNLRDANERLHQLAMIDGLTGIANRRYFDEVYDRLWRDSARSAKAISVLMIDIDCFKQYNDTYGHQMGDVCLQQVAKTIASVLHRPADFVARYGGEEFIVLLPDTASNGAEYVAESIRIALDELNIPHIASPFYDRVTVSIGGASSIPETEDESSEIIIRADHALYQAKQAGRNRVVVDRG